VPRKLYVGSKAGWTGTTTVDLGTVASGAGGTFQASTYVHNPRNKTLTYSLSSQLKNGVAGSYGITVNAVTGAISVPTSLTATETDDTYSLVIDMAEGGSAITTLTLSGGGSGKAWTFGHAFKQGDVPSGYYIAASGPDSFQADIRNRWPDGSVKFAVLSGVGGTSAQLFVTTTVPDSGEVSLLSSPANVVFTGGVTGTATCPFNETAAAFGDSPASHTNGLVRKFSGPVMTERHYYVKTADAHVRVWFYVRSYVGGAIEVETVVENGWLNVTGPTAKSYSVAVNVGSSGNPRYSDSLTHYHHSRWSRVDWVGTAPNITPSHNVTYLKASKLVPNYSVTIHENFYSNVWDDNTARYTRTSYALGSHAPPPYEQKPLRNVMGGGGYDGQIGLMPEWDAAYIASGDGRAWHIAETASRANGGYSIHYRDETNGLPLHVTAAGFAADRTLYGDQIKDNSTSGSVTPTETGGFAYVGVSDGVPTEWVTTHHPSIGFLQYLTSGRWYHLEELAFVSGVLSVHLNPVQFDPWSGNNDGRYSRRNSIGGMWVTRLASRATAWAIRAHAQLATIAPTTTASGTALKTAAETVLRDNVRERLWYGTESACANTLGITSSWGLNGGDFDGPLNEQAWMHHFVSAAAAYAWDLKPFSLLATAAADNLDVDALAAYTAKWSVGVAGTVATNGMNWRNLGWYSLPLVPALRSNPDTDPWVYFSNFNALAAYIPFVPWSPSAPLQSPDDTVIGGLIYSTTGATNNAPQAVFSQFYQSYVANAMPSLAYANAQGRSGAASAYARVYASSNLIAEFASSSGFQKRPVFAIT
jgi:hypothetical protein